MHINAFNFPVWGMLEKLAPALLAGVPAIVKPATATRYLTELVVRRIVETGLLPRGRAAAHLRRRRRPVRAPRLPGRRLVHRLRGDRGEAAHASGRRRALRALRRRDRLAQFLDARAGRGARHARVRPVRAGSRARDDGQGRAEVHGDPQGDRACGAWLGDVVAALQAKLAETVVGDPRTEGVRHGAAREPRPARRGAGARRGARARGASSSRGDPAALRDSRRRPRAQGAFLPPMLLLCRDADAARAVHSVEAFGPVSHRRSATTASPTRSRLRAAARAASPARSSRADDRGRRRARARARAVSRARARREPALREGIDRPRLAARAARARRPGPRGRRRGARRHPRRAALHAAHGRAGLARHHHGGRRALGARRTRARPGHASVPQALPCARDRRHLPFGGARGHGRGHRALRGAVGRQLLCAHGRDAKRRAIRCSAAAWRTAIS